MAEIKMTPMLRQWAEAKEKAKDAILLFRMGDFYELFGKDAEIAAPILDLALTSRDKDKGEQAMPMAGFPFHAATNYIAKLVGAGFRVAVCDQLEDPKAAKGIVKRDITRIVTPGTVVDEEQLKANANNYLVAISIGRGSDLGFTPQATVISPDGLESASSPAGDITIARGVNPGSPHPHPGISHLYQLAALDLSTADFRVTQTASEKSLLEEISRLKPAEILIAEDEILSSAFAEYPARFERVARADAPAMILAYVAETQQNVPGHLGEPVQYSIDEQLLLDPACIANLDLPLLQDYLDKTKTAVGARLFNKMLLAPSCSLDVIRRRHDFVDAFLRAPDARHAIQNLLRRIFDVERLVAKVASPRAELPHLNNLCQSIEQLPAIVKVLQETSQDNLVRYSATIDLLQDLAALLRSAMTDTGEFRAGYDAERDEYLSLTQGGREQLIAIETKEREATGINSLKIKYTRVFGYYIEITKTHLAKVPEHYKRKQTVAGGERYVTAELHELERQIESAEIKLKTREAVLFEALKNQILERATRLLSAAKSIAELDVYVAFAEVSDEHRYVRPMMLGKDQCRLSIEAGRHPVLEILHKERNKIYVANDVALDGQDRQVLLITGPNMAGKSTMMRQVALIQILAQAGCFVPAKKAELSICDRIFTRVGAADDLATGRSTFMVEMTETAEILRSATRHSLVLLDEIGRGTSTYDGLAIAWSVAECMHSEVGARTLFATHYHELTELAGSMPRLKNVHAAVRESDDSIAFLYTLIEGAAQRSYGIHVARLAGLPPSVLKRASEVLEKLEADKHAKFDKRREARALPQLQLF